MGGNRTLGSLPLGPALASSSPWGEESPRAGQSESFALSLALMLILGGGAVAGAQPQTAPSTPAAARPPVAATSASTSRSQAPIVAPRESEAADGVCRSQDERDIVVCAQRRQGYRLDPSVMDAEREVKSSDRSASAPLPAAQAACSSQPTGCGTGLEGLDLANAAIVIGTAAIKAAKGEDWTRPFKMGSSDEYRLYLQAKQRREAQEEEKRAEAALRARQTK